MSGGATNSRRKDKRLMIVPGYPHGLVDLLILDRILQHHAGAHLADHAALDFLPGGLGGGIGKAAARFEILAALTTQTSSMPERGRKGGRRRGQQTQRRQRAPRERELAGL